MFTVLYNEATQRGPVDGEDGGARGFLFSPSCSLLLQPLVVCIKYLRALATGKCYVIFTTDDWRGIQNSVLAGGM